MSEKISRKNFIRNLGLIALWSPALAACSRKVIAPYNHEEEPLNDDESAFGILHPGILSSGDDLVYMRSAVKGSGAHPMKAGYQKMLSTNYASLDYKPKAFAAVEVKGGGSNEMEDHFRQDGLAAYAHALNWVITGEKKYGSKSIEIMNLWADTCESIYCPDYKTQPTLEASWALPIWISAAEIIRYYKKGIAGWPEAGINKFESFVKMMCDTANGPIARAPNWHISRALARMAAGVFLNDKDLYKQGYSEADDQIGLIGSDGKPSENARDFGHCQYNVIATAQCAEIAFHQGDDDLYLKKHEGEPAAVKPLIFRQSEYFVREMMGNIPQGGINYSAAKSKNSPPYEMVLRRYQSDFDMKMPYTGEFVAKYNRPADSRENHFAGWTTLTHAK